MKLYDVVKTLLENVPELRNSDKKLLWSVYIKKGLVQVSATNNPMLSKITLMDYLNAPSAESVTRARRKVQENHPELQATSSVVNQRRKKQATKGTFIYREQLN